MDATGVVAIYGAVLSTAVATAQLARWRLLRRTRLRVEVEEGYSRLKDASSSEEWSVVLWIHVINDGEREEQVAWVYVDRQGRYDEWQSESGLGAGDSIRPRQRKTYIAAESAVAEKEEADFDIRRITTPYRVRVVSGRGQEFLSARQVAPLLRCAFLSPGSSQ